MCLKIIPYEASTVNLRRNWNFFFSYIHVLQFTVIYKAVSELLKAEPMLYSIVHCIVLVCGQGGANFGTNTIFTVEVVFHAIKSTSENNSRKKI